MCDNINQANVNKLPYTCKPGNGQSNNTDAICTVNGESNQVLYNSGNIGDKGVALSSCCKTVVNNATVVESNDHLSNKCLNGK